MQAPLENTPDAPPLKRNRGWFQPGDLRINREGRPRGSKAGPAVESEPADLAPAADRLMLLFVPTRSARCWLRRLKSPYTLDLPEDFEITSCRLDVARDGLLFTVRSRAFARVARGAPIPELSPKWNGGVFA
jgi:hypothetical protein